jgi:DNA-binding MarR family transcriptional regulator
MKIEDLPEDPTVAAWVTLVLASNAIIAAVAADGKAAGFPPLEWYDVLWDLERHGGAVRPFEMEGRLLLAQYNLSRLIDRMVKAGFIEKYPCERDGRGLVLGITEAGKALRKRMWPVYRAAIQRHVGTHLDEKQARMLSKLLMGMIPRRDEPAQDCGT